MISSCPRPDVPGLSDETDREPAPALLFDDSLEPANPRKPAVSGTETPNMRTHAQHVATPPHLAQWCLGGLFDRLPTAAYLCDTEGRIVYFNKSAEYLWGRTPEVTADRFCGAHKALAPNGEELPGERSITAEAIRTSEARRGEIVIERPDGSRVSALIHASPVHDGSQRIVGVISLLFDNSEQKAIENNYHSIEQRFSSFMRHLPCPAWIKDSHGRYVYANEVVEQVQGRPRSAIYGRTDEELFSPDTAALFRSNDQAVLDDGRASNHIEYFRDHHGKLHQSLVCKFPLYTPKETLVGGVALSITERLQAEAALRAFFSQSIDGCFVMMLDEPELWNDKVDKTLVLDRIFAGQRITEINHAMLAQYGATREQMLGKTPADFFAHDLDYGRDLWRQMLDTGKICLVSNERTLGGAQIWIEGEYIVLYDVEGRVTGHIGVQRDVTDRKRVEDSLRMFRMLMDQMPDVMEVIDVETGRFLDVNETACRAHGLTRKEYLSLTVADLDPIVKERTWADVRDDVCSKGSLVVESQHRRKDGSLFPVEVNCRRVTLDRDYLLAVVRDISDRKQAEADLHKSEQHLRLLADALPARISYIDRDWRYQFVNKPSAAWHGLEPHEVAGRFVQEMWDPQVFEMGRPHIEAALSGRPSNYVVDRIVPGRGERMVHHVAFVPDLGNDGTPRGCISLVTNVTEEIRAREALLESQHRIYVAIQATKMGPWDWNLHTNEVVFSPEWKRQLGYEDHEVSNHYDEWENRLHPDDRARALGTVRDYLNGTIPEYSLEFRLRHKNGSYRWIHTQGAMLRGPDGKPAHLIGCHVDITDRKRAEETMRQIVDVVASTTGQEYFSKLVNSLSRVCDVKFAIAGALDPQDRNLIRTIAVSHQGESAANFTYDLRGTPCENVAGKQFCHYPDDIQRHFPDDTWLVENNIRSYMGIPLWSSTGEALGLIVLASDIPIPDPDRAKATLQVVSARCGAELERTRAELALRESEERLSEVIGHTPNVAIQWYDSEGRVKLWNDASERMFGFSEEEALGKTLDQLIHTPEENEVFREALASIARTGQSIGPSEFTFRRRNGDSGICLSSLFKIPGDHRSDWFVCMDIDITERKQAEEDRRRLEAQVLQSQKLESLGVLAGGIAHDFNNLLTAMLGYAELTSTHLPDDSPVRLYVREIEKAAQRAAGLTQQMLAYSGRGTFVIEPIELDALVLDLSELLRTVISKKVLIELNLQPATIEGDVTQIRQVVMNLITNASDSLEGRAGTIYIRTRTQFFGSDELRSPFHPDTLSDGQYACFEVEDPGCGMSDQTLERIFEPFFTTKFTGRGLGLAAVLGIVRAHRGTILVRTALGQGSLFQILIPCSSSAVAHSAPPEEPYRSRGEQGTVLVIDDEASVRNLVRQVLEREGYRVVCAEDAESGFHWLRNGANVVAILLDLTMPQMDGVELLTRLHDQCAKTPVLVMSGYSLQEVSNRIAGLGVRDVIQKPFSGRELVVRLNRLISAD